MNLTFKRFEASTGALMSSDPKFHCPISSFSEPVTGSSIYLSTCIFSWKFIKYFKVAYLNTTLCSIVLIPSMCLFREKIINDMQKRICSDQSDFVDWKHVYLLLDHKSLNKWRGFSWGINLSIKFNQGEIPHHLLWFDLNFLKSVLKCLWPAVRSNHLTTMPRYEK